MGAGAAIVAANVPVQPSATKRRRDVGPPSDFFCPTESPTRELIFAGSIGPIIRPSAPDLFRDFPDIYRVVP